MIFRKKNTITRVKYTFSEEYMENVIFSDCIKHCHLFNTSLVIADFYFSCDAETAKYRGRIFCIDGSDTRFPPLTNTVLDSRLSFSPFIWGVSIFEVYGRKMDPVRYSNRPFIDDRSEEEKEIYLGLLEEENRKELLSNEYLWLKQELPNIAPKSLNAYSRMKNSRSKGYLRIVDAARILGHELE